MTNAHNIELFRPNVLENQETAHGNHVLLDINAQNNIAATPGRAEAQNNITAIPSCEEPNRANIECELKESLKFEYWDVIRENSLLLVSYGLLYLDFDDACHKGYSGQIEQCFQVLAILIQGIRKSNYAGELIHLVACLKKIWGLEMRKA